jgi:hypothetical protein
VFISAYVYIVNGCLNAEAVPENQEQDGEEDWTVPTGPSLEEKLAKEKAELRKGLLESWDEKRSSKYNAFKLSESNRLVLVAIHELQHNIHSFLRGI